MSTRVLALACVLSLVLSPALARAEEAPAPAPQPAPDPAPAPQPAPEEEVSVEHTSYDMAMADGGLPQGWTLGEGDEAVKAENALKDAVFALAKTAGVSEEGIHGVARSAKTPAGLAVLLLVDLEQVEAAFAKDLAAAATKAGWEVRTMGARTRLLVVAAPADVRAAAVEAQSRWAARMLAMKAWSAIAEYGNLDRGLLLARAALAMDAKSAGANHVLGRVAMDQAQRSGDAKGFGTAVERLRAAVASDASSPLAGSQAVAALGDLGGALLLLGGNDAAARDVLKKAVAGAAEVERAPALGHRYNLACAHGRLKELDEAFAGLGAVLAEHAKDPIRGIDHWREDPDFANLKSDPRWAKLLETYGASGAPHGD
jgi:hypothetical protein